jgi:hypothetical protein
VLQGVAIGADAVQRRAGVYIQPTTLQIVELSAKNGALVVGRENGPALIPLADDRFRISNAPVEFVFSNGAHAGFERRSLGGGRPVPYEWRQRVTPTRALLAQYAGRYVSDELGGSVYTIAATDSSIALRTGTEDPTNARLLFADTFFDDGYTIQFIRTRGAVSGFEITDGRMRRVRFARRDLPPT